MAPTTVLLALLLASYGTARQCSNFTIPVDITSRQGQFKQVPVESNVDAGAFAVRLNQFGFNYTDSLLESYQTLQCSYKISAQYCRPDSGSKGKIQLLNHGIGFDKTYWDLSYNNYNYSYVNSALAAGYSTLAIDRLGIGNSSHGDPLNEIQAQAEIEALNAVTTKLRNGGIPEIGMSYNKVIHVGHSFGSVQSFWLSALYPNNSDGLVLTGYSPASAAGMFLPYAVAGWDLHSARLNQPLRLGNASNSGVMKLAAQYNVSIEIVPALTQLLNSAGVSLSSQEVWDIVAGSEVLDLITDYNQTIMPLDYPSGYLAPADLTALQYVFLYPGQYDLGLAVLGEKTKQPVTTGELLTITSAPMMSAFKGPVLVFTGEHDVPFCGGNCYAPLPNITAANLPAAAKMAFPSSSAFSAHIQPKTGHGLTFHYNATAGYQVIQNWLGSNGLGA